MHADKFAFNRRAVKPIECLRGAWQLVKDEYWLFLGITFIGQFLASMGPLGLLVGPVMCGIHLCLLRHERGLPISFDMLFQGFNYFVQSLIATLIVVGPMMLVFIVTYLGSVICGIAAFALLADQQAQGQAQDLTIVGVLLGVLILLVVGGLVALVLLDALFFFTFPLIVDRELSGFEAAKLSYRAAMGNLGGLLGLILVTFLLDVIGVLMCYFGVFFLLPIHYAMVTIAYRQVFPPADDNLVLEPIEPDELPAPVSAATGISLP